MNHFPVRDPLSIRALALLTFRPGNRALHSIRDAFLGTHGNVRLHAAFPERNLPQPVGRTAGTPHAVFVDPHVAVRHRDRIDIRVQEVLVPGQGVRDAVDVIPAAGVESKKVLSKGGADLH